MQNTIAIANEIIKYRIDLISLIIYNHLGGLVLCFLSTNEMKISKIAATAPAQLNKLREAARITSLQLSAHH